MQLQESAFQENKIQKSEKEEELLSVSTFVTDKKKIKKIKHKK